MGSSGPQMHALRPGRRLRETTPRRGGVGVQAGIDTHKDTLAVAVIDPVGRPHLKRQIVGTDENRIDPRQAVDGFGVFDSLRRLGLQHDQNLVVRLIEIVSGRRVEIQGV